MKRDIIQTIRCQILQFNGLSEAVIAEALVEREKIDLKSATKIAHQAQGNYNSS
jgi:DNA polymerase-3 subunit delta'